MPNSVGAETPWIKLVGGAMPDSVGAETPWIKLVEGAMPNSVGAETPWIKLVGGAMPDSVGAETPWIKLVGGAIPDSVGPRPRGLSSWEAPCQILWGRDPVWPQTRSRHQHGHLDGPLQRSVAATKSVSLYWTVTTSTRQSRIWPVCGSAGGCRSRSVTE